MPVVQRVDKVVDLGFSRKGAKFFEELWVFRGRVPKSSVNYGFSEEGCCVKDIVHERARLLAVVQCSGGLRFWSKCDHAAQVPAVLRRVRGCASDSVHRQSGGYFSCFTETGLTV